MSTWWSEQLATAEVQQAMREALLRYPALMPEASCECLGCRLFRHWMTGGDHEEH